ncbi:hypothetical protein V5799_018205, partial [Amblyomma americanum]
KGVHRSNHSQLKYFDRSGDCRLALLLVRGGVCPPAKAIQTHLVKLDCKQVLSRS